MEATGVAPKQRQHRLRPQELGQLSGEVLDRDTVPGVEPASNSKRDGGVAGTGSVVGQRLFDCLR